MPNRNDETRLAPVKAADLFPELLDEVDKRIAAGAETSVAKIKIWILSSLVVYVLGGVTGLATIIYYAGGLRADFLAATQTVEKNQAELTHIKNWAGRKDAIDDEMIHRMEQYHQYKPPIWYGGRDFDRTEK